MSEQAVEPTNHVPPPAEALPDALREALQAIEKQIGRLGREQFKATSVAEAQVAQLTAALEQLRLADTRREAELVALRERNRSAVTAARLEVAQSLLPAIDSLEEALRAGYQIIALASVRPPDEQEAPKGGWLRRLFGAAPAAPEQPDLRAAMESWLRGLTFVRQRMLHTLASEDVRPINAVGYPFDPQYHIAMDVVPADEEHPIGTVIDELRTGYLAGERVLRHAEVIVAADPEHEKESQT